MGRLMIQNEAQGLGGALEHLLFLKISEIWYSPRAGAWGLSWSTLTPSA
jgi:hypothetical protein